MAVLGFLMQGTIDNFAHGGGLAAGFLLGKLLPDRPPADPRKFKALDIRGWTAALAAAASFALMLFYYFSTKSGPSGVSRGDAAGEPPPRCSEIPKIW